MVRISRPLVLGLLLVVALGSLTPASQAAPSRGATHASPRVQLLRAQHALDKVQEIFSATGGTVHADATIALRNLAELKSDLPAAERRVAERYFARPSASSSGCPGDYACWKSSAKRFELCTSRICVHYVRQGSGPKFDNTNGVDPEDNGAAGRWPGKAHNGVPDMVEFTLKQLAHIDGTYRNAGYRSTLGDGRLGGDSRRDIYLGNIGSKGLYGYCTSDDSKLNYDANATTHPAVSAYCVLDNNYSKSEFPYHAPRQNMEVTAAHEYFHAVQFAYDFDEDSWFMEATATWAEDQLYTSINDNRGYLPYGPMGKPQDSLDAYSNASGNAAYLHQYGTWIFFRYLTEHHPTKQAGLPILVRRMWQLSVGKSGYSVAAIKQALAEKGANLDTELARFVIANRRPGAYYREGWAYRPTKLDGSETLAPAQSRHITSTSLLPTSWNPRLAHLSSATYRFLPTATDTSLDLDLTATAGQDVEIAIVVHGVDGSYRSAVVPAGGPTRTLAFDQAGVAWIEVSLINAGTAYTCWNRTNAPWEYTCQGTSADDRPGASLTVTAA